MVDNQSRQMKLTLPWPPSVNHYWGRGRGGRVFVGRRGVEYRSDVSEFVAGLVPKTATRPLLTGGLAITVDAFPPDRRRRDLDNLWKSLLDSLGYAGVYADDSQIADKFIARRNTVPGGRLVVCLWEIEPAPAVG